MKINPESTIYFRNQIKRKTENGAYSMSVNCAGKNIPLKIFPEVFPPQQEFLLGKYLKDIHDISTLEIADIGTGSGVEAIIAASFGAKHVDAIDINPKALKCSRENAQLNMVSEKISFALSDLFSNINKSKKYNLILANLPFIDYDGGTELIDLALYDNNHATHKSFFKQAKKYLTKDGRILLSHANLQSHKNKKPNEDFDTLEKMIIDAEYSLRVIDEKPFRAEYIWRLYELKFN